MFQEYLLAVVTGIELKSLGLTSWTIVIEPGLLPGYDSPTFGSSLLVSSTSARS